VRVQPGDRDLLWSNRRRVGKLQAVDFPSRQGPITVQRGWWFSSHEQWKFLLLPYAASSVISRVFHNNERARTWASAQNARGGLFASVNDVTKGNEPIPSYISATGVQEAAFQKVDRLDVVTPYGAFPTIMANLPIGLGWYLHMLKGPRMQGPFGSTEAVSLNGTRISPLLTWDAKITSVLALASVAAFGSPARTLSVADINARALKNEQLYTRFYSIVDGLYSEVFKDLKGENIPYALPSTPIPVLLTDFPTCTH